MNASRADPEGSSRKRARPSRALQGEKGRSDKLRLSGRRETTSATALRQAAPPLSSATGLRLWADGTAFTHRRYGAALRYSSLQGTTIAAAASA
jgi:hypothetical protein